MSRIWAWLGLNLGKHAGLVSVVGLVVTVALGIGITRLEFATGQDSYLNRVDQVYIDNVDYQGLFGGQAMVTLYTMASDSTVVDLFTSDNIARWRAQEDELRHTNGVFSVISPLTALELTPNLVRSDSGDPTRSVAGQAVLSAQQRDPDPASVQLRQADALTTLQRLNGIPADQRTFDNPDWVRFLLYDNQGDIRKSLLTFFPDDSHANMITRLTGNASLEDEGRAAEAVIAVTGSDRMDHATTITTGASELLKQLNDYLRGGMLMLGAVAVAIMILILLVLFDVRWRLLPLVVVLIGVVWAFGLAGYIGIPLSVVTISGLPVMLGVGIDYAIQMHARIEEEVVIDRAPHPIQETARKLGPALLVVTFDAIFAFAALRFAQVPMIRHFGQLLIVGIAAICFCSIIMPLSILGIREYRSPTKGRDFRQGPLGQLVAWLGSLPASTGPALALASLLVFAGGIAVEHELTLQTDPEQWVNQHTDVIRKIRTLQDETGTSSELGIFVQADDPFSDETVTFVQDFADRELTERPDDLLTGSSIVTTIGWVLDVPGATHLDPTGQDVASTYEVAPPDIQRSLVNPDAGALNVVFRTGVGSLEQRAEYTDAIGATGDGAEAIGVIRPQSRQ